VIVFIAVLVGVNEVGVENTNQKRKIRKVSLGVCTMLLGKRKNASLSVNSPTLGKLRILSAVSLKIWSLFLFVSKTPH